MARGVVLLGGGIDSTTVLVYLRKIHTEIELHGLHVCYGQKAYTQEWKANRHFCDKYSVRLKPTYVDLPDIASSSILVGSEVGKEIEDNKLEGRNIILLSLAATYARTIRADSIYVGYHKEPENAPFPDATKDTLQAMQQVFYRGYSATLSLEAPLKDLSRLEIYRLGVGLDPEIRTRTFTCYEDGDTECGKCTHCLTKAKMEKDF